MAAPTTAALVKKVLANPEPSTHGPSRQAAFFSPSVANGALRTWLDLQLAPPSRDPVSDLSGSILLRCEPQSRSTMC